MNHSPPRLIYEYDRHSTHIKHIVFAKKNTTARKHCSTETLQHRNTAAATTYPLTSKCGFSPSRSVSTNQVSHPELQAKQRTQPRAQPKPKPRNRPPLSTQRTINLLAKQHCRTNVLHSYPSTHNKTILLPISQNPNVMSNIRNFDFLPCRICYQTCANAFPDPRIARITSIPIQERCS